MKTILISLLMLTATVARAQITIAEPKFEQEATIVMNDTAGVELQLEYAKQKRTENVGTAILFGEGNKSLYYEISGAKIACDAEQRLLREGFAVDFFVVRQ